MVSLDWVTTQYVYLQWLYTCPFTSCNLPDSIFHFSTSFQCYVAAVVLIFSKPQAFSFSSFSHIPSKCLSFRCYSCLSLDSWLHLIILFTICQTENFFLSYASEPNLFMFALATMPLALFLFYLEILSCMLIFLRPTYLITL